MNKNLVIIVLVALVAGLGLGYFLAPTLFGKAANVTTITNPHEFESTVKIGTNGSTVAEMKATTCSLVFAGASSATFSATTTKNIDCAVTGIASGDFVLAQFPRKAADVNGWIVYGASASTTAGYVTLEVGNALGIVGGSVVMPSTVASTTQIFYVDN